MSVSTSKQVTTSGPCEDTKYASGSVFFTNDNDSPNKQAKLLLNVSAWTSCAHHSQTCKTWGSAADILIIIHPSTPCSLRSHSSTCANLSLASLLQPCDTCAVSWPISMSMVPRFARNGGRQPTCASQPLSPPAPSPYAAFLRSAPTSPISTCHPSAPP